MVKSKPVSRKRISAKVGKGKRVTVANLRRLVTQPAPARTFVNDLRLEMGSDIGLPSAFNNNASFDNFEELYVPPKLGNSSNAHHNRTVKLPLLRKAIASGAGLNQPEIPADGRGNGHALPVMPWRPSAPSVGPSGTTFSGFGPFGALSPDLAKKNLGFNVNSMFGENKGGRRRRRTHKSKRK